MTTQLVEDALQNDDRRFHLIGEMSASELHEFLNQYNFDDGFAAVWAVIESPACELATALLAFWLCDPDFSTLPPAAGRNDEHARIISHLYAAIGQGTFRVGNLEYDPDQFIVNKLQRLKLERAGLPGVFISRLPPTAV